MSDEKLVIFLDEVSSLLTRADFRVASNPQSEAGDILSVQAKDSNVAHQFPCKSTPEGMVEIMCKEIGWSQVFSDASQIQIGNAAIEITSAIRGENFNRAGGGAAQPRYNTHE